jgi:hypothetical protein
VTPGGGIWSLAIRFLFISIKENLYLLLTESVLHIEFLTFFFTCRIFYGDNNDKLFTGLVSQRPGHTQLAIY